MIPRLSPWMGALTATMLALLTPYPLATAQAPPPDVRYIRIDADDYYCVLINAPPTETFPSQETPIALPPTFTPSIFATPTPTAQDATPTQEIATPQLPHATLVPKPTVTPTSIPTSATTPLSACVGWIMEQRGVNVRSAPYIASSTWRGVLGYGAYTDLHGYTFDSLGNKWYRIWWGNEWAYIAADYVSPQSAACGGLTED